MLHTLFPRKHIHKFINYKRGNCCFMRKNTKTKNKKTFPSTSPFIPSTPLRSRATSVAAGPTHTLRLEFFAAAAATASVHTEHQQKKTLQASHRKKKKNLDLDRICRSLYHTNTPKNVLQNPQANRGVYTEPVY